MGFVFELHGNTYAVSDRTSGVLPSAVARLNWAIPTSPEFADDANDVITAPDNCFILKHLDISGQNVITIRKAFEV